MHGDCAELNTYVWWQQARELVKRYEAQVERLQGSLEETGAELEEARAQLRGFKGAAEASKASVEDKTRQLAARDKRVAQVGRRGGRGGMCWGGRGNTWPDPSDSLMSYSPQLEKERKRLLVEVDRLSRQAALRDEQIAGYQHAVMTATLSDPALITPLSPLRRLDVSIADPQDAADSYQDVVTRTMEETRLMIEQAGQDGGKATGKGREAGADAKRRVETLGVLVERVGELVERTDEALERWGPRAALERSADSLLCCTTHQPMLGSDLLSHHLVTARATQGA
jgi:DNA repair exonuclease SbcCD ATPase subunit